jgi:glycosyltransferase involved in cell wall biosynthesis
MRTPPDRADRLPLVSVVIPAFNARRYVGQAIKSALDQTYPEIEVILVDDGSTDGTAEVPETCDPRVRVIAQPNRGVAMARNAGIEASSGDYVAFLDADDLWLPSKIARQMSIATRSREVGLVFCGYSVIRDDLEERYRVPVRRPRRRVRAMATNDAWGILLPSTGLIPRVVFSELGAFDPALSTAADHEFMTRISRRYEVDAVRACLTLYRAHGGQMHRDVRAFDEDAQVLIDSVEQTIGPDPDRCRRAIANLEVRLAHRWAACGDLPRSARHVSRALQADPSRLVLAPAAAAARRLWYRLLSVVAG